jgi:hypothetical protein
VSLCNSGCFNKKVAFCSYFQLIASQLLFVTFAPLLYTIDLQTTMMMMMMKSVYLCFLLLGLAAAFSPTTTPKQNRRRRVSSSSVQLIPGLDPVDAAIAIVSAAAGAATQFSRVQSLEKDLVSAAAGAATQSSRVQSLEKDLDATRSALALVCTM